MSAYFQMGHDTENLVGEAGLEAFRGIVLSPVNRNQEEIRRHLSEFREKGNFDIIFDPQLYCPKTERRHLPSHPYFPQDIETADLSSLGWWQDLARKLAVYTRSLEVDAVCSPAMLPKKWTPDYYVSCAELYEVMADELANTSVRPIMTVCVYLKELADVNDALRIASIVTSRNPAWCYLVVESELEPRREIADAENLASLMVLISCLERGSCRVLVSQCCSDMLLAKAAGASHCSTGKSFNLRRFTRGRFEEPEEGGRQIPYWFEHSLLAFLREADIARLRRDVNPDYVCFGESNNIFAQQILEKFANAETDPKKRAWLGLSWRQYLAWFGAVENRLSGSDAHIIVNAWLKETEQRWTELEDKNVLFDERRNDGSWIRRWRQALSEFRKIEY